MLKVKPILKVKFTSPGEKESAEKPQYGGKERREFQVNGICRDVLIDV